MIDLPNEMLREMAEEESELPQLIVMNNLIELAYQQKTLKLKKKGKEVRFTGKIIINNKDCLIEPKRQVRKGIALTNAQIGEEVIVRLGA